MEYFALLDKIVKPLDTLRWLYSKAWGPEIAGRQRAAISNVRRILTKPAKLSLVVLGVTLPSLSPTF